MRLAPNVTPDMLQADFWLRRVPDPDAPICTPPEIEPFNARVYEVLDIPPVLSLPDALPRAAVEAAMRAYVPDRVLFTAGAQPAEPASFAAALDQITAALPDPVPVQMGLITARDSVRAFPTAGVLTSRPFEYHLDRIQETTVDVGWPVAALAASPDEQWLFCLTPLYWGWVPANRISLGPREAVERTSTTEPFIVATASRGGLVGTATGRALACQMGTRFPLVADTPDVYQTVLPTPAQIDGPLLEPAHALKADFAVGWLPCTLRTLFTQAFRLLGEPYAWGGMRLGVFGRDCSRFVQDVYAGTGVRLPRNGDQQARVCQDVIALGTSDKAALVEMVPPGAILVLPGHVMLYLGAVNGEPYAIHSTSAGAFSEVVVSDLSLGTGSAAGSLLQRLTQAVIVKGSS